MKIISLDKGCFAFILGLLLWCSHMHANYIGHSFSSSYWQSTVSGTVSDAAGPLPGVTIYVKGSSSSAVSDDNGRYAITAAIGDTLIFSFLGFKDKEQVIVSSTVDVVLAEDAAQLQEVVINAGYYSVKDKERTGSIARITSKDIEDQPVSNPLATLQGRMAGVDVVQNTGVPGGGFSIKIRGRNSLRTAGNDPLYIIDGMPFTADNLSSETAYQGILPFGGSSPLNGINPNDIESIEILKDADATAIYGARGANGVVLITTKKGRDEKTRFTVNADTGVSSVTRFMKLMNTPQYLEMRRQAFANDGFSELPDWAYDLNGTWDQNRYTDWQEELIGGTAVTHNLEAGISGGSESTRYLVRGTTFKESTVFPGDFAFRKAAFHVNLNHRSKDQRFKLELSANYVGSKNDLPGNDLTYKATILAPNAPELYNSEGGLNWEGSTWENPLAILNEGYKASNNSLTAGTALGYTLFDGLEIKALAGYVDNSLEEKRLAPNTVYDPAWGYTSAVSNAFRSAVEQRSWNFEPQLEFKKRIGPGEFQLLGGLTFQERKTRVLQLRGTGFANNSLLDNLSAATTVRVTADNETLYRYNAVFGRLNYNVDGKYILNLTGRRDGSSRFGPGKRFASFGAAGLAWIFSKEKLFENVRALSFGKLRGSYGTTGSDQIGDYQYLSTFQSTGVPYDGSIGLQPVRLFNPDFSWETNKKLETALELGFLRDRLFFTAAHYRNRSSSQLVGIPLPAMTGFPSIQANLDATVENTGWELDLKGIVLDSGSWNWTTSVNVTFARNKLLRYEGLESSPYAEQYVIGRPLDIVKVYNHTGVDPTTGLYTFEDYNGDGQITWPEDNQKIVSLSPDYYGGFQNSLSYKNWTLDFLIQFVKQQGYNRYNTGSIPGLPNNQPEAVSAAWQPGISSGVQRYTAGYDNEAINAFYDFMASDGVISDASFLRLKNVSLSYTLPEGLIGSTSCRIYFQGQNLLTLTKFDGADPENQTRGSLPPLRTVSFGVQLDLQP